VYQTTKVTSENLYAGVVPLELRPVESWPTLINKSLENAAARESKNKQASVGEKNAVDSDDDCVFVAEYHRLKLKGYRNLSIRIERKC